jgi:hypothetical protein
MHAIDPTTRFLTKFPAHSLFLTTALYCHPSTYRHAFANPRLCCMRLWAGHSSRPSIRAQYTGSPTSHRSPGPRAAGAALSTSTQLRVWLRAAWTAPRAVLRAPRAVPSAARSPACRARSVSLRARTRTLRPDCRAPRKPPSSHLNPSRRAGRLFGRSALQSAPSNALSTVCPPNSQRLPPDLRTTTGKQGQPACQRVSPSPPLPLCRRRRRPCRHRRRRTCASTQSFILLCSLRPIQVRTHPLPHPSCSPNFLRPPPSPPPSPPAPHTHVNLPSPTYRGQHQVQAFKFLLYLCTALLLCWPARWRAKYHIQIGSCPRLPERQATQCRSVLPLQRLPPLTLVQPSSPFVSSHLKQQQLCPHIEPTTLTPLGVSHSTLLHGIQHRRPWAKSHCPTVKHAGLQPPELGSTRTHRIND